MYDIVQHLFDSPFLARMQFLTKCRRTMDRPEKNSLKPWGEAFHRNTRPWGAGFKAPGFCIQGQLRSIKRCPNS